MAGTRISTKGGLFAQKQQEQNNNAVAEVRQRGVATVMNELLDSSGIKNRIKELLGSRAAQFTGSMVSLVNASPQMQQAFHESPMTIIQAGLRAATYDLPVDPGLGYAYIVPFKNKQADGQYRMEASFLLGYKGLYQMAMRTGVYVKLNVTDIREGELKSWDRLTEDIEIEFIEDDEEREARPIIGYCGFFRLVNGMEKYVYWSVEKIKRHEQKHRKGKYMNPVWNANFDAMARKTVLRELIGRWGIMSIDYRTASVDTLEMASSLATGKIDDEDIDTTDVEAQAVQEGFIETEGGSVVDTTTGEILSPKDEK